MRQKGFGVVGFICILGLLAAVVVVRQDPMWLKRAENVPVVKDFMAQTTSLKKELMQKQQPTLDVTHLMLGDGNVSTSPKVGYVYACDENFRSDGAEGKAPPWIHGSSWDMSTKVAVTGGVSWPKAEFTISVSGIDRILSGNGLPVKTTTGTFPVAKSDPAYAYDKNPNSIKEYRVHYLLPVTPLLADKPSCVPRGVIGYALNGVAIYNALDDAGKDAVAHEVQDSCGGHPQAAGVYHYHGPNKCIPHEQESNALVGYALDGFGIYSPYDANGQEYTNADLDECHGITDIVNWDGETKTMYHYVLTQEYPYTIGCFRGTPVIPTRVGGTKEAIPTKPVTVRITPHKLQAF